MRGLSLVAASGGHSSSRCAGLSLSWPLLLRSTCSRRAGSVIVAHGPSRSAARGIFPDQGSNPCPLHRQADSQPLRHEGSPQFAFLMREKESLPFELKEISPLASPQLHSYSRQISTVRKLRLSSEGLAGNHPASGKDRSNSAGGWSAGLR